MVLELMLVKKIINLLIAVETSHWKREAILNTLDTVKVQKVVIQDVCYCDVSG